MQHDTTVYQVPLAEKKTKLIASLLYLRYSKRRYLKFYRAFNRFGMKCFLHEAFTFWGYSCGRDASSTIPISRVCAGRAREPRSCRR